MYSDWVARNPGQNEKQVVNIEFVLKKLDDLNGATASADTTLTDATESSTLPTTTNTAITTLLQTIKKTLNICLIIILQKQER